MKASKFEVFHIVYEATKHRITMDKIDKLFALCNDTLVPVTISDYHRKPVLSLVENIQDIKEQLKDIEHDIKDVASQFDIYKLLLTMTDCGPLTAATVIAESGNINRFKKADCFVSYTGSSPKNKVLDHL